MMHILIESASKPSLPELAALHAACFGRACWGEDQIRGSLMLESTVGWAALAEGIVAGFLLCQRTVEDFEILTFGVHPSYQRRGIGKELLSHMLAQLPSQGSAFLDVAADNEAARRLYEKYGFREISRRKGYYLRETGVTDAICYRFVAPDLSGGLHA